MRKSMVFTDSFDVSLVRFGSGKSSSNSGQKVLSFVCKMGVPTCLAVFVLCVVLSEPATAAGGQKASDGATMACNSLAAVITLTITK